MSRDGARCAAAVQVLLEAAEWGPDVGLAMVWDMIEARVSRAELRAAVARLAEVGLHRMPSRPGSGGPCWWSDTPRCAGFCRRSAR